MQDLDRLCEQLSLEQLQQVNERLSGKSHDQAQEIFEQEVNTYVASGIIVIYQEPCLLSCRVLGIISLFKV